MSRELKFKKMKNLRLIVLVNTLLLMATFTSCKKEPVLPTIITSPVGNIGYVSATSGGYISDDGGAEITARGIVWNTSPYPTTANYSISDSTGSGTGNFTCNLTGLTPNSTYYVRSYAINSAGTAYGDQQTFSATGIIVSNPGAGVTYNGYTYSSVVLGNGQEWMSENLQTGYYRNGEPIQLVLSSDYWYNGEPHYSYSGYDPTNNDIYGKLYNFKVVTDPRQLCPTGWHVPTNDEWTTLTDYLGGEAEAGDKMKTTNGWNDYQGQSGNGTNESGFSGLPGGVIYPNNSTGTGSVGQWWSASFYIDNNTSYAWARGLSNANTNANQPINQIPSHWYGSGFSVRCLKD
jgi:uncharacterized protein (TIGR02145 family)